MRLGATLGFAELALGGVTTVMDMFWHPRQTVAAARAVGLRVATGGIFFDGVGVDGRTPTRASRTRPASSTSSPAPTTSCPAAFPTAPTPPSRRR